MVQFLPLPQFQTSPLLDLSPITTALQRNRQAELQQIQMQRQAAQDAEARRRFDAENAMALERLGIDRQAAARQDQLFPGQLAAQGATLAQIRSQTGLNEANAAKARTRDEMDSALAGLIRGLNQPQQPGSTVTPPAGPIRPQSFEGGGVPQGAVQPVVNGDMPPTAPNVIRTQTAAPVGQQPELPEMVNTPVGKMPIDQARKFGFALALGGKGDAGKLFTDAANANAGTIGKAGMNKIDEEIIAKINDLGELDRMQKQFSKDYLGLTGKAKAYGLSWKSFVDHKSLSKEERSYLQGYARFAANTQERMNTRIKAMAGSAVSGHEEVRLNRANPNMNDDPDTFQAKMIEQINLQRAAVARYNWLKNVRGLNHKTIGELAKSGKISALAELDDMKDVITERGNQIQQELLDRGVPADKIGTIARQRIKREFGI